MFSKIPRGNYDGQETGTEEYSNASQLMFSKIPRGNYDGQEKYSLVPVS